MLGFRGSIQRTYYPTGVAQMCILVYLLPFLAVFYAGIELATCRDNNPVLEF